MTIDEQFEAFRKRVIEARNDKRSELSNAGFPELNKIPNAIAGCGQLRHLSLGPSQIEDIEPLSKLRYLKELHLNRTKVSDLWYLSKLASLEVLNLSYTPVAELGNIYQCEKLQRLYLTGSKVESLDELSRLRDLSVLALNNTPVRDISPLGDLRELTLLSMKGCKVKDLHALWNLTKLSDLFINALPVLDLRPLRNCPLEGEAGQSYEGGLDYRDTLATRIDPNLADMSVISDDAERTRQTMSYLRSIDDDEYDAMMSDWYEALDGSTDRSWAKERPPSPAKIRTALQQSYPDLRDRAQYLVALLQDEQAQHKLMPVPNSDEALEEYQAKARFLEEMLAGVIALHEALPEEMPDLDDSTVLDLRARLVKIAEVANRGITYLDQHEGTYGSLWKLGVVSAVGGLIALVPGVNFLAGAGLAGAAVLAQTVKVTVQRAR